MAYDSENHMISMTKGSTVVTMVYDAFGNRVGRWPGHHRQRTILSDEKPWPVHRSFIVMSGRLASVVASVGVLVTTRQVARS